MKKLLIKLPEETKTITAQQVAKNFADEVCDKYGWDRRSAAWRDLAQYEQCADGFLMEQAAKMYPGAEISWENDPTLPPR